ncbi:A1pp-domain-containing protein [Polychaeton citri CBS 116435]|uniref:A1pp-domain-containing protein n=1 Tax=Polychaeton citri CBS 116435 TaxID=1314669 RepID=A0A9P4Q986_9PEZI|nr:A1pp-domain-containing protein [Polychaeton citri CBS 116435]
MSTADLPTLPTLYKDSILKPPSKANTSTKPPSATLNSKISLVCTDLTSLRTDAIVNAANTSLLGGGGVDGAIHRAAGPKLLAECRTLHGCATGSAKITDAYDLPCQKVIHAVGPVYDYRDPEKSAKLLKGCYVTSLGLLKEHGLKSIAFSALSTGVYGYPSKDAAEVAIGAVREWLEENEEGKDVDKIVFCSFLEKDERAYESIVPKHFPPAEDK